MTGVVTAIYDVPVGKVLELSKLERLKSLCNNAGLEMEVIESIPVHEDIKLGKSTPEQGYIRQSRLGDCNGERKLFRLG